MDRKPWQDNGSHRGSFGSNRSESSDRRSFGRRSDRRDGFERSDRSDRSDRFDRSDRREGFGRSDRREGFGGRGPRNDFRSDRREGFSGRGQRGDFRGDRREKTERFSPLSGPRARAVQLKKFDAAQEFAQHGIVKLDADLKAFFQSPAQVNKTLRQLVEWVNTLRPEDKVEEKTCEAAQEECEQDEVVIEEDAQECQEAGPCCDCFDEEDEECQQADEDTACEAEEQTEEKAK